jgi:transposase InsO family protein
MEEKVLPLVQKKRKRMSQIGGIKLHHELKEEFEKQDIKLGRDKFYDLLRTHGLLVKKTKRYHITTDSKHFFYKSPNLLKDLNITHSEQVWVTDITYIKLETAHAYLALVTDTYSKKIMGYSLELNMKVQMVKDALKMALKNRSFTHENIIHHSDRGIQYCCPDYSEFATKSGMILSTTEKYDPYENAVAERINGILKYEFGMNKTLPNLKVAQMMIKEAVHIYNTERPHFSLNLEKPAVAHLEQKHIHKSYHKKAKKAA